MENVEEDEDDDVDPSDLPTPAVVSGENEGA
jgi:hypothetical protein